MELFLAAEVGIIGRRNVIKELTKEQDSRKGRLSFLFSPPLFCILSYLVLLERLEQGEWREPLL